MSLGRFIPASVRRLLNRLHPGMPRGVIPDAREWARQQVSPANRQRGYAAPIVLEKYPAELLVRQPPRTLESAVHPNFQRQTFRETPRCAVFILPEARLLGREGYVLSLEGRIFEEFTYCQTGPRRDYNLFRRLRLPDPRRLSGVWATIAYPDAAEFFHFEAECLPRLHLIEELEQVLDGVIVPYNLRENHLRILAEMGFPRERLVFLDENSHWQMDQLVVPSYLAGKNIPPWVSEFLQRRLNCQRDPTLPRRIYISRADARWRRVSNEAEILEILEPLGFQVIQIGDLSAREQRQLFHNVDFIVAPHGAALTNLLYCRPDTTLLELFSPHHVDVTYWTLCEALGINYWYMLGEVSPRSEIKQDFEDIRVAGQRLEQTLDQLFGSCYQTSCEI